MLAEIAYTSFNQDQLFFLKDDITKRIRDFLADTLDAPKYLDGLAVLQTIEKQQGILVERATDIYSFSHLTLQEYLTAFHISQERLEQALIDQHLIDERWREVFLLMAGLSGNRALQFLGMIHEKIHQYIESRSDFKCILGKLFKPIKSPIPPDLNNKLILLSVLIDSILLPELAADIYCDSVEKVIKSVGISDRARYILGRFYKTNLTKNCNATVQVIAASVQVIAASANVYGISASLVTPRAIAIERSRAIALGS